MTSWDQEEITEHEITGDEPMVHFDGRNLIMTIDGVMIAKHTIRRWKLLEPGYAVFYDTDGNLVIEDNRGRVVQ
jgi:hypothetical protein